MNENEFIKFADMVVQQIFDDLEKSDSDGVLDIDFLNDTLNIKTDDGYFVVNRNSAAREIWLSSPISGPSHFVYQDGVWLDSKGRNLHQLLQSELTALPNLKLSILQK